MNLNLPETLDTRQVTNLKFIEPSDKLQANWWEWLVSFDYFDMHCMGNLQACAFSPETFQDNEIYDIDAAKENK